MRSARMPSMHLGPGGGEDLRTPWGEIVTGKISDAQTGGAFSLAELSTTASWCRRSYVHHEVDECFYVIAGTFAVGLDDREERVDLTTGAVLFVPRGVARSLSCTSHRGRLLVVQTPGRPFDPAAPLAGVERVEDPPG